MSFIAFKEVPTHNLRRAVIGNSITSFATGWALQPGATGHNAAVVGAGTSNPVLGVCLAIEGNNGQVLEKTSVTTASNNETVVLIKAVYIPSNIPIDYVADFDAAVTTDSKNMSFFNMKSGNNGQLDSASGALFGGTAGQFWSYGVVTDPVANSSQCIGHWFKTL